MLILTLPARLAGLLVAYDATSGDLYAETTNGIAADLRPGEVLCPDCWLIHPTGACDR